MLQNNNGVVLFESKEQRHLTQKKKINKTLDPEKRLA